MKIISEDLLEYIGQKFIDEDVLNKKKIKFVTYVHMWINDPQNELFA